MMQQGAATSSPHAVLVQDILALNLFNSHAGYDVDADMVFDYIADVEHPSVQGFQDWLNDEVS